MHSVVKGITEAAKRIYGILHSICFFLLIVLIKKLLFDSVAVTEEKNPHSGLNVNNIKQATEGNLFKLFNKIQLVEQILKLCLVQNQSPFLAQLFCDSRWNSPPSLLKG